MRLCGGVNLWVVCEFSLGCEGNDDGGGGGEELCGGGVEVEVEFRMVFELVIVVFTPCFNTFVRRGVYCFRVERVLVVAVDMWGVDCFKREVVVVAAFWRVLVRRVYGNDCLVGCADFGASWELVWDGGGDPGGGVGSRGW